MLPVVFHRPNVQKWQGTGIVVWPVSFAGYKNLDIIGNEVELIAGDFLLAEKFRLYSATKSNRPR
jgi:hypothetical protein